MTPPQPEKEPQPPRVSVVVVSHNRVALLSRCLESVERSVGRDRLQTIVVDNGSTDGSAQLEDRFPKLQYSRLPRNFGLTKALNIGMRAADAEYVLFLHDDTEISPETAGLLADALDADSGAAAVCPLLVDEEGRPAPQIGSFPPDDRWQPASVEGADPVPVEYPRGAALMVRVYFIKALRQIDQRYGQFGSDAELAAQIRRASKKILLVPAARVRHQGGDRESSLRRADVLLGRAAFLGKYRGLAAWFGAYLSAIFQPLLRLRLGEFRYAISAQKIDGSQP